MNTAIAIDFGTSNTVLAQWNLITNQPETLTLANISDPESGLIPSLLYFRDATRDRLAIGQQVINSGYSADDQRYFGQIKRHLLFDMQSPEGAPPTCWRLDQVNITPQSVGSLFLRQVFDQLRSQDLNPTELVLTAPVQSYERYLRWLESTVLASDLAALREKIRIIDEPTAAALGYAIAEPASLILVVDFGGGTLDLCLVRTPRAQNLNDWGDLLGELAPKGAKDTQVEVIAKTGQSLGGTDIDRWLLEDYSQRRHSCKSSLLLPLMEKIKIALSMDEITNQVIFDQGVAYDISYTRHQLQQILKSKGFYGVLQNAIDEVVSGAVSRGILKMDIKHVVLIGGSSLIPSVQELIASCFPRATMYHDRPFEAVVKGALMLNHGLGIRDHLFHSYAIRYWRGHQAQFKYQPLFLKGQSYPTRYPYELILRASQPAQTTIDLVIGELDQRSIHAVEVVFEGDRLVTKIGNATTEKFLPLADTNIPQAIATLDPPGQPGHDRLKVLFSISDRRQLLITVIDLETATTLLTDQVVAELR